MSLPTHIVDRSEESLRPEGIGRPVRVCFVVDRLLRGGVELQLLLLLKWLDRSRTVPYVCLLDGTDDLTRSMEPKDCPVIRLGVRRLLAFRSVAAARRLARFFRHEKIDVVHALFPDSLYFGATVARMAGVPCVAGFRVGLDAWSPPRYTRLANLIYRLVDGTMANCEACRQAVIAEQGVPPESVVIVPNGVDLSRFANGAMSRPSTSGNGNASFPRSAAQQRVGIAANLRPVKNLELFVRAAGKLAPSHPQACFDIAGEGELRDELQSLIACLGLCDRVKLLGAVSDIPAFLNTLDVAVLCSHSEGSPNAIMEYMAAGLPSVVTDVGGNRELIEHGRYGLVVPPNDLDQLSAAIARLLDDRPLATRMGVAAREHAFTEFSVEAQARRYEDFYRNLLLKKQRYV